MESESIPRMRCDIEVIPTSYRGERVFVVKDSLGLIPEPVLLQAPGIALLRLIDGRRSLQDIQLELIRQSSHRYVALAQVAGMVRELDNAMLLDSSRYRQARAQLEEEYHRKSLREPCLAGKAYPADKQELQAFLTAVLDQDPSAQSDVPGNSIQALVAPHIDLNVGRRVYGRAYDSVRDLEPQRVILLGTGHSLQGSLFSVSGKSFSSPLGTVLSDRKWTSALKNAGGKTVSAHDLAHKGEHALEFQLLFCQHLFKKKFSLIPILCGSFHEHLNRASRPSDIPGVGEFLSVLRQCIETEPSTLVIAGVDFSHIGLKFGHGVSASVLMAEAQKHDRALLSALRTGSAARFWEENRRVEDRYHVCGFSAMACLLELFDAEGHTLDYEFWEEEATQSAVSFAAVLMTKPGAKDKLGENHE
jgi:AmmeMemoRadiSam system protein B